MSAHFFHLYKIKDTVSLCLLFDSLILKIPSLLQKKKLQQDIYDNRFQARLKSFGGSPYHILFLLFLAPSQFPSWRGAAMYVLQQSPLAVWHLSSSKIPVMWPSERYSESGHNFILKTGQSLVWVLERALHEGQ